MSLYYKGFYRKKKNRWTLTRPKRPCKKFSVWSSPLGLFVFWLLFIFHKRQYRCSLPMWYKSYPCPILIFFFFLLISSPPHLHWQWCSLLVVVPNSSRLSIYCFFFFLQLLIHTKHLLVSSLSTSSSLWSMGGRTGWYSSYYSSTNLPLILHLHIETKHAWLTSLLLILTSRAHMNSPLIESWVHKSSLIAQFLWFFSVVHQKWATINGHGLVIGDSHML